MTVLRKEENLNAPTDSSVRRVDSSSSVVSRPYFWLLVLLFNFAFVCWIYETVHRKLDYEAFYSAGRAFLVAPQHVYDPMVQMKAGGLWQTGNDLLPFYHPPNELILFAPLSLLPYATSLMLWRLISCAMLLAAVWMVSRELGLELRLVTLAAFGFVPAIMCLGEGQDSILLLLLLTLAYVCLRNHRDEIAGVLMAAGLFKPQVVCVVAAAVILTRRWRFLASFIVGTFAILGSYTAYLGTGWTADVMRLIRSQESLQTATWMVSLRGLVSFVVTSHQNSVAIAISVLLWAVSAAVWIRCRNFDIVFGSGVLVGTLAAFHFHVYDVTLYLLPIAILLNMGTEEWDRYALVVFFVSPIVIFLMALHFTATLATTAIVFLFSYWRKRNLQSELVMANSRQPALK